MAGYCGYSKSNNAVEAEENGIFPLSHVGKHIQYLIIKNLGFKPTLKDCKALAEVYGTSEWHHSSKFYNRVDYYDSQAIFDDLVETFTKEVEYNTKLCDIIEKNVNLNVYSGRACDTVWVEQYRKRRNEILDKRKALHKQIGRHQAIKFLKTNGFKRVFNPEEKRNYYYLNNERIIFPEIMRILYKFDLSYDEQVALVKKYVD